MHITPATETSLTEVSGWLTSAEECLQWAGPRVTFPITMPRLINEIMFCHSNSYCAATDKGTAAFGQIIQVMDDWYHLARIIAKPGLRHQGIGKHLCLHLINEVWLRGGSQISLNVYRHNTAAVNLYQRLGFCEQVEQSDSSMMAMLMVK